MDLNFSFTIQEVQIILNALGTLPHDRVRVIIDKITTVGNHQLELIQAGQKRMDEYTKEDGDAREEEVQ